MKTKISLAAALILLGMIQNASGAQGEMGTGIPKFGVYGAVLGAGGYSIVWALENATVGFPTGCSYLTINNNTLGSDVFKVVLDTMTTARITRKRLRFYSHAPRDFGCGVDYVELVD